MKKMLKIQVISIILMMLGLIFMVVSWTKTNDIKYVLGGMVFISIVGMVPSIISIKSKLK